MTLKIDPCDFYFFTFSRALHHEELVANVIGSNAVVFRSPVKSLLVSVSAHFESENKYEYRLFQI